MSAEMHAITVHVRNALPTEHKQIGQMMVSVYSRLTGFPTPADQPAYYQMLSNVGNLTTQPETELLVAVSDKQKIVGAVVYFGNIKYYGSGGTATQMLNASGFRLLVVDPSARQQGIGKLLTKTCIDKAKLERKDQLIIHTTMAMQPAWKMYEGLGFERSAALDFMQADLPVFGFRLMFDGRS